MRRIFALIVLVAFAMAPVAAVAQQPSVYDRLAVYHRLKLGSGEDQILFLVMKRPQKEEFFVLMFENGRSSGYSSLDIEYDCVRNTYNDGGTYHYWNSDRYQQIGHAEMLQQRFGISPGGLNRAIVCERQHEAGTTVTGYETALAEGRLWQRLNASTARLRALDCDNLRQVWTDAIVEYGFSPTLAEINDRLKAVAGEKQCDWATTP